MCKGNLIVAIVLEYFGTSFVFSFPIGKEALSPFFFFNMSVVLSLKMVSQPPWPLNLKTNEQTYTPKLFLSLITFLGNIIICQNLTSFLTRM